MEKFVVYLKGYYTLEYTSTKKEIVIEANNLEEADEKARKWCEEHSFMGGYDWFVERIFKQ